MTGFSAETMLQKCVELSADKKARDLVSLRLSDLTTICDYFLLMTASNTRQAQSICDNIEEGMKAEGQPPLRIHQCKQPTQVIRFQLWRIPFLLAIQILHFRLS